MSFDSITNRAEFFSDHYLDARLATDLADLRKAWDGAEGRGTATARTRLRGLGKPFFTARAEAAEAGPTRYAEAVRALNDVVLAALGFTLARQALVLPRSDGTDELRVAAAARVETPTGLFLIALDAGLGTDVDELFDTEPSDDGVLPAGRLLAALTRDGGKTSIVDAADAPGELFSVDDPPRLVILCAGTILLLAERSKWAEGRFLAVDLDAALERSDTSAKGELDTIGALFSADALVPGHLDPEEAGTSFFDEVDDKSTRHAVGVSKELREGMRRSVEVLANEVIEQRLARNLAVYSGENRVDPTDLTRQCLRYLYRLIVLLYAESRPELGVLPTDDDAYLAGYSLDRLRELVLVDLEDDHARNGTHLDQSLRLLFDLVNDGYHAEGAEQALVFDSDRADGEPGRSVEDYLQFPGLDATIFDPGSTPLLDGVDLRNESLQKVLVLLLLSQESKRAKDQRGFISYAQLGINQLGAVYEGLMAYTGFFATDDLFEVAKNGDPSDGTWMVPVDDADDYDEEVFVKATDLLSGRTERVRHERGSFVYRLAGRDRQRSASYYTPEVLTSCVVRHALAELLGTDDHARVPGGSAGVTEARQILDLTVCEPALGSGAFLNEAINQLSAEYLKRRQAELGETLDAEAYQRELQKVKAHFALHQCFGVDLNVTAVELAEVSLWLNCMYPGLKAPWFGLRLRRGNSLIGARRATWRASRLKDKVWAKDKASNAVPPQDRPLAEPLDPDEIHHFLLPGHGWGAVAARKEARELAPDHAKALAEWRKAILKAPSSQDAERLTALAAGVERLWAEAADLLDRLNQRLRRPLGLYGMEDDDGAPADSRRAAETILHNPDSSLGRLRLVMDAWVGLWFWTLDGELAPPSWRDWLMVLERIVGPEPTEPTGQLDLFADLAAIQAAEAQRAAGRESVTELIAEFPWLARAQKLARREGAWHWELEFAPLFRAGGFDLQVGNPPWTKLFRSDTGLAEDFEPHWGLLGPPNPRLITEVLKQLLDTPERHTQYLIETAVSEGTREFLTAPQLWPNTSELLLNLYLVFVETTWRHLADRGCIGLLHPESHFLDPSGGLLRAAAYQKLRRHFQFINERKMFEDVHNNTEFSVDIYGSSVGLPRFINVSELRDVSTLTSLDHDGTGPVPGIQYPEGGWDLRPHRDRVISVDREVLADWARLFDEPSTPPEHARLLRPATRQDLAALSALADQTHRLADSKYHWTSGWHEKGAKTDGFIRWETATPTSWDEAILQGPHFTVATPFDKQPNENCKNNRDYSSWDLESLPERAIPRTNYQRATERAEYDANIAHWVGRPSTQFFRHIHREMTQPSSQRSVQGSIVPTGAAHIHACLTYGFSSHSDLARWAGLLASIPIDYLFKISGTGHVADHQLSRLPFPSSHRLDGAVAERVLRLNCLTADYAPLWAELYDSAWQKDCWADPGFERLALGDIEPTWTMATPLRRDFERRLALVEIDALAALMLGLTAEQLCAMYRTQFAVLRKYEYAMAFDSEGRKICAHHQSAGYRQSQLQQEAKDGARHPRWKSVWKMYEEWEEDPDSVDWEDQFFPPFTRPDREAEMTRAYIEFQRRLEAGEYG
jgi:hypothetical protein